MRGESRPARLERRDWTLLGLVAATAFLARLRFSLSIDEPLGVDGYYYAVQLRALLSTGHLYYPGAPLTFYLLAPFAAALGPIVGLKVGAALASSLGTLPAAALVHRVTRDRLAAHLAGLLVAASLDGNLLATEFVKQSVGTTLLLACFATVAGLIDGPSNRRLLLTVTLLTACALTHTTSAVLAVWFAAPILLVARGNPSGGLLRSAPVSRPRTVSTDGWRLQVFGAIGLAVATLGVALATRKAVLGQLFKPLRLIHRGDEVILRLESGPALAALVLLVALAVWRRSWLPRPGLWVPVAIGPASLAVLINLPWLDTGDWAGPGPRLLLLGFLPLAILLPIAVSGLGRARRVCGVTAVSVLLPLVLLMPRIGGRLWVPPPELVPALDALRGTLPENAVLITQEHAVSFQVKWFLDREATSIEPPRFDPGRTYYRLLSTSFPAAAKRQLSRFESTLPPELPRPIHPLSDRPLSVVLVAEPTWRAFVAAAPDDVRRLVDPWPDEWRRPRRRKGTY